MNVFFDIDYTILSVDQTLRRGTRDVFAALAADGHNVYVWSGEGRRPRVVTDNKLDPYVTDIFAKPINNFAVGLRRFYVDPIPDFVIDDYPQIVEFFGGYHIKDFYWAHHDDDELQNVYDVINEVAQTGTSNHQRWKPRHADTDDHIAKAFAGRLY